MAKKEINDIEFYKIGDEKWIQLKIAIKYNQRATTFIYKNGFEIVSSQINDFELEIVVNKLDEILITTTIADISKTQDDTGIDYYISCGENKSILNKNIKADIGDIVLYSQVIYIIK